MKPALRIEMSDFEHVWSAVQNLALHPFENNLYHIIPILGAFTWGYTPIVPADCGQTDMIPKNPSSKFFNAVETLCKCASFKGTIDLYTSLIFHFTSFGGRFSCTNPIIVIPYHRLFRPDGSSFCGPADQSALTQNIHALSDDETSFFLAREIAHIKFSDIFLKTTARVAFIASLCFLYGATLSWTSIAAIGTAAVCIVLVIDRIHEYAIDRFAALTLSLALDDRDRAFGAAISSLEKQVEENKERRKQNRFCQFYITALGDNLLDLRNPFLSHRIAELRSYRGALEEEKTAPAAETSAPKANAAAVLISR